MGSKKIIDCSSKWCTQQQHGTKKQTTSKEYKKARTNHSTYDNSLLKRRGFTGNVCSHNKSSQPKSRDFVVVESLAPTVLTLNDHNHHATSVLFPKHDKEPILLSSSYSHQHHIKNGDFEDIHDQSTRTRHGCCDDSRKWKFW